LWQHGNYNAKAKAAKFCGKKISLNSTRIYNPSILIAVFFVMQIIGHRGARGEAPENTLGGFAHLRDLGVLAVEFDVRQLADGELVVIHDENLLRTAGVDAVIEDLHQAQLPAINQTQGWPDWPQPEPLASLMQVMQSCRDFSHIEVEIKAVADQAAAERMVQALARQLAEFKTQVTITSFDLKILQALHTQDSDFKRGLLVELPFAEYAIQMAKDLDCQRIGWKNELVDAAIIASSQRAGLEVSVWTVNDVSRARWLQAQGIHGLITDHPQLMLEHLA
jgi:glycerophosphoryl diester phosphodiesterase